jgi:SOS response associated peptidase (SRAP)
LPVLPFQNGPLIGIAIGFTCKKFSKKISVVCRSFLKNHKQKLQLGCPLRATRPFFRGAFKRNRCLIPVSGYYEWQDTPGGKQPSNDGVDTRTIQSYLGHKSIQHTVRYTELAPTRFKSLFRD